jgi:alkaline phosphatase
MQDWIIQIMNQFGYIGIALLIMLENVFPPIPSEVILTFGGFMTTYTSMNFWGVVIFATIGSVLGAIVLYLVGRCFTIELLEKWLDGKIGKLLHFKKEDVSKAIDWFSKWGNKTVFFCRFVPIIRSLISIPAGVARMNMATFLILTTIGTFIWNIVLVYLGTLAGASWETIAVYFDTYSTAALVFFILLAAVLGFLFYKSRFSKKAK